jgi:(1->4)-alpha-D-glucan 1-alpha-D-glucosylmutase
VHTSWINHNEAYETAVGQFVERALDPARSAAFLEDFTRFQLRVARPGYFNSLAQVILKIASPGVPDFYQGTELWDFSLVDPDNRRPVDFQARRMAVEALRAEAGRDARALAERLVATPEDGRLKVFVTMQGLRFRRAQRQLFERGQYAPLPASGARATHVVAFARVDEGQAAVAITGRHFAKLPLWEQGRGTNPWDDTKVLLPPSLAGHRWRDVLTDRVLGADSGALPLGEVLSPLPVALLQVG